MPTYSLSVYENDDIQGIRFKVGRNSIVYDEKSRLMKILEGLYKLRIRESEKTQDRIGIVHYGDLSE